MSLGWLGGSGELVMCSNGIGCLVQLLVSDKEVEGKDGPAKENGVSHPPRNINSVLNPVTQSEFPVSLVH